MKNAYKHWEQLAAEIKDSGLWKTERIITTPQGARIDTTLTSGVINMCANNYLGLANNDEVKNAAIEGIKKWGYGYSSVRFICGTSELHKELEAKLSSWLQTEDTILYSSCYDANGGLFETILGDADAIISDELNHASIIDGIRLCKAARYRYKNNDMADLEEQLKKTTDARIRAIVTDGVFSMDGNIANLKAICDLADKYDCIVIVDDSHGVGVVGEGLRGA
ncbi:MAG: aminotransferase class I/II-fold pyridoxal phosphate-dependent enzyme, partial [Defluviitaleaceae bacterium]|nr:aminotransferase class I/II-fold pyridoxal phosphate-dependent enzyme [Defluviitaleaceae bacterium]